MDLGTLRYLRRKIRANSHAILLYSFFLFATASLAYYHKITKRSSAPGFLFANVTYRNVKAPIQHRIIEYEVTADFNTFDLYRDNAASNQQAQRRQIERKKEKLKVFVLPFSHVDPGWLETFDSYLWSTNGILDNMVEFMSTHERMRFMWMELVFFERWYSKADEMKRTAVKRLVENGQLEFASGSWTMTDEASAYLFSSIENIVLGQQYLQQNFNVSPSVVFSNDPFGYSNSVPFLFTKTGIKRNVINRIHHDLKRVLQNNKAIPFVWKQFFDKTGKNDILTQVLPYTHYDHMNSCGPSAGTCCKFDFRRISDWYCNGVPNVPVSENNLISLSSQLTKQLKLMHEDLYEAPVILMMHGDDFRFVPMTEWYQQHDNLIKIFDEINKGDEIEIKFGTFNDYFTNLEEYNAANNITPPSLTGDFFPYKCALGSIWTGYFSTRPFFKRQERFLMHLIRTADLLGVPHSTELEEARRNLSLFQHHDAITGTSRKDVMADYSTNLYKSMKNVKVAIDNEVGKKFETEYVMNLFPSEREKFEGHTPLDLKEPKKVVVYNPLPYEYQDVVTVKTLTNCVKIEQSDGYQVEPSVDGNGVSSGVFQVSVRVNMKPLSFSSFVIDKSECTEGVKYFTHQKYRENERLKNLPGVLSVQNEFKMENDRLTVFFNSEYGSLKSIQMKGDRKMNNIMVLEQFVGSSGGAYIMSNSGEPETLRATLSFAVSGPVRDIVYVFYEYGVQVFAVEKVNGKLGHQMKTTVFADIRKKRNTELVVHFDHDPLNETLVFSDSDGLQLLRREQTPNLDVSSNYYPMPSALVLASGDSRITVTSDIPHGFRIVDNRTVEIMLDRILNKDDGKGLGSSANAIPDDMLPVKIEFAMVFESTPRIKKLHYTAHTNRGHVAVQRILFPPVVFTGKTNENQGPPPSEIQFPCDVQLLDVRRIDEKRKMLIVFRHGREASDDDCNGDLKKPVLSLLRGFGAKKVARSNLSGTKLQTEETTVERFNDYMLDPYDFLNLLFISE